MTNQVCATIDPLNIDKLMLRHCNVQDVMYVHTFTCHNLLNISYICSTPDDETYKPVLGIP